MDLNKLLSELADEIDITDSQEGAIKRAYNGVADWLNQNDADISLHDVHIFPQGSMMYGTAIKPIDENDYDIDLVCEFIQYGFGKRLLTAAVLSGRRPPISGCHGPFEENREGQHHWRQRHGRCVP